jgi:thioesterase domain-containing protein
VRQAALIPLNAGSGPALICVYGASGEVFSFSPLARLLEPDFLVFGLQSPGIRGHWPPTTLEEFARRHVGEILAHDAAGPCRLLAHCAGGFLALEIARQLTAAGRNVELVALIDTVMPGILPSSRAGSPRRRFTDWFAHCVRIIRWRTRLASETLLGRPTSRYSATFRRFADYAFKQALQRQSLQPYAGPVAAFLTEDPFVHRGVDARKLLLQRYMPQAQVFHIPGTHYGSLRQPHVAALADALRTALRQDGAVGPAIKEMPILAARAPGGT